MPPARRSRAWRRPGRRDPLERRPTLAGTGGGSRKRKGERSAVVWMARCSSPEDRQDGDGGQGRAPREGQPDVVGAGGVHPDPEERLRGREEGPGADAQDPGDLALVVLGELLAPGIVRGEEAQGAGA